MRPAPRRTHALLCADAFAITAIAPNGKVRFRRPTHEVGAFDVKPPHLLVYAANSAATVFDSSLQPIGDPLHGRLALLPDGTILSLGSPGAPTVRLGASDPIAVADPPALWLNVGPRRGDREWLPNTTPAVAADGGVALPWTLGAVRLGHIDSATGALSLHVEVHLATSLATHRAWLPGRTRHVLAGLDAARDALHLAVVDADGTVTQHEHRAFGLPAREGDALWWQRDEETVVNVGLDGRERGAYPLPEAHRGPGAVFVQGDEAWFIPWHGEVVIAVERGEVIDRKLPGDAVVRRHVAGLVRRLCAIARPAGLDLQLRKLHTIGGASPTVLPVIWHNGGDLGPFAHCVAGVMLSWAEWCPPPGATGLAPTGGWVIAVRTADTAELLDALATLDAHGLVLRDAAAHWGQIYAFGPVLPFRDAAAEAFLGAMLTDETGAQRAAAERALAHALTVDELATAIERLRSNRHIEPLVGHALRRHRPSDATALAEALADRAPRPKRRAR